MPEDESMRRPFLPAVIMLAAIVDLSVPTAAQTWPTRPLTLVVPFAAGGPSDVAGRIIAQRLGEVLGQQVVVENPSGAGGTVGSNRVAKAAPDGYQFVIGNIGTHAWSQSLYKKPPYNTLTDFVALSLVVESPRALIAPKNFPANSLPEFVAYIKANQATAKFGSAGAGSASHVSCILLNAAMGVSVTHVPYRGLGPAMQDLIAGRVDYMCDSPSTSLPQIETNLVKAIATTGQQRASSLPGVPTALEQGLDFDVTSWQGLFLPKGTPEPIVRRLTQAVNETLDTPAVRDRFEAIGEGVITPERRGPDYFAKFVASEIAKWAGPIKASGVTVE
jgi:tripartite-type tricarboxylate transporter receptor subunit TctC